MKQSLKIIVIGALLVAGIGSGAWLWRGENRSAPHAAEDHHEEERGEADRVELTARQIENAGLIMATAGPQKLPLGLTLYGRIEANQDRLARVAPRYPGIVQEVTKHLGDEVAKNEVLAVVESNESLQSYPVKAQIAGTVTAKNITVGEFVSELTTLYTVADLSSVWVDLNVYRQDFAKLRVGQKLLVDAGPDSGAVAAEISYLSPFGAENTQSLLARAVVPNPRGELRPGLFVTARVVLEVPEVALAVPPAAVQLLEEREVVFVRAGDTFTARPVKLGRRSEAWLEVLTGLKPGENYVAKNSFLLKAELGKAAAEHEH